MHFYCNSLLIVIIPNVPHLLKAQPLVSSAVTLVFSMGGLDTSVVEPEPEPEPEP
jgi:hypothetical protein